MEGREVFGWLILVMTAIASELDTRILYPGEQNTKIGDVKMSEIRQYAFDFVDEVTANVTSSCTILCLLRATPMDWRARKKQKVKMYLSIDGPPSHSIFQKRGTVRLDKKESTGIARINLSSSQVRLFVGIAGPNTTAVKSIKRVNFTLKIRASCSPPVEDAIQLDHLIQRSFVLKNKIGSNALLKVSDARAPSFTFRNLDDTKASISATYAFDEVPAPWLREAKGITYSMPWRPFKISCTESDTYITVFSQKDMQWDRDVKENEKEWRLGVEAAWDHADSKVVPGRRRIIKLCRSNTTLMFKDPTATPWFVWVKAVPNSEESALRDLLSLDIRTIEALGIPGAYLNPATCSSPESHATAVLDTALTSPKGGTLSPPAHVGYQEDSTWLITLQSPAEYCMSFAIEVFTAKNLGLTQGFTVGQKLEAMDFLGNYCVATVQIVDHVFQRIFIHFDGWGGSWDFWTRPDSALIAPVGTAKSLELPLDPPRGYIRGAKENFEWPTYLEETASEAVPSSSFKQESFFELDYH